MLGQEHATTLCRRPPMPNSRQAKVHSLGKAGSKASRTGQSVVNACRSHPEREYRGTTRGCARLCSLVGRSARDAHPHAVKMKLDVQPMCRVRRKCAQGMARAGISPGSRARPGVLESWQVVVHIPAESSTGHPNVPPVSWVVLSASYRPGYLDEGPFLEILDRARRGDQACATFSWIPTPLRMASLCQARPGKVSGFSRRPREETNGRE